MAKYIVRSQRIKCGDSVFTRDQEITPEDLPGNDFDLLVASGSISALEEPKPRPTAESTESDSTSDDGGEGAEVGGEDEVESTAGARELAEQHGIDLSEVTGTGSGGKVIKPDVEAFIAAQDGGEGAEG